MQLTAVRKVFETPGPYVTVHASVGRSTEDARQQLDARWTTIRHELEHAGIDEGLREQIGERLRENVHQHGEVRRTIVAAGDRILIDDVQQVAASWPEVVEVADLPDLSGWLAGADSEMPFALVLVDREGADIDFYRAQSRPAADHVQVSGQDFGIRKVAEGDWANKQYQQSAENAWHENAEKIADALRTGVRRLRPRVVLVAGDPRMRSELAGMLEDLPADVVDVEAGGRSAGASQEALWDEVRRHLAALEAHDQQELIGRLEEKSGQGSGAAVGVDDVLDAFVQGQVERLLLDLDAAGQQAVRVADHPGLSVPVEGEAPADRVLLAAAALTDAEVSLLPSELAGGAPAAALLRWDDRSG